MPAQTGKDLLLKVDSDGLGTFVMVVLDDSGQDRLDSNHRRDLMEIGKHPARAAG